ncbi:hypothetical protein DEU56DRAFT_794193 [Suillus clintonianus]|uniref:uncharacterized protein n=1 Tax=Suillus clintonianus TaxID=1904413 RepID=UPI001B86ECDE|nr:uncharacterized protein DEU56DRAFT_794193 [Suillus clintonianus]KAG2142424.1 hypothetical protein DEU56DRAFT_794193 [Suillus clintonianus]
MNYRIGSPASSSNHRSWAVHSAQSSSNIQAIQGHWSALPASSPLPIPNTPLLHSVSLPHPNAASHQSPMSYQHSSTSHSSFIVLHSLLSYGPNLRFNITRDLAHVQLRPGCPPTMLQEFAVQPLVSHMIITVPELPAWTIEVVNPRGVTVNDVLAKIRETLNRSVAPHEMQRSSRAVNAAIDSFRARSRADSREHAQGVKRVDFLGPKFFFAGLARARDGSDSWEIHFSQSV